MIDDRRKHEEEMAQERERGEREMDVREREMDAQKREMDARVQEMSKQMKLMRTLVETQQGETVVQKEIPAGGEQLRLTKLADSDDIETYIRVSGVSGYLI